jgi:hypothetical protein
LNKYADFLYTTLKEAKVDTVSQLKNVPVAIDLADKVFTNFRILTEVL